MGEHRSAGSVNARRAAMQSVPVEGLAWFVELILAIGLLTACTAGLTFSFGVEILPWSLYLTRLACRCQSKTLDASFSS